MHAPDHVRLHVIRALIDAHIGLWLRFDTQAHAIGISRCGRENLIVARRRAQSPLMGSAADQPHPLERVRLSVKKVYRRQCQHGARRADREQDQQARIELGSRDRDDLPVSRRSTAIHAREAHRASAARARKGNDIVGKRAEIDAGVTETHHCGP